QEKGLPRDGGEYVRLVHQAREYASAALRGLVEEQSSAPLAIRQRLHEEFPLLELEANLHCASEGVLQRSTCNVPGGCVAREAHVQRVLLLLDERDDPLRGNAARQRVRVAILVVL